MKNKKININIRNNLQNRHRNNNNALFIKDNSEEEIKLIKDKIRKKYKSPPKDYNNNIPDINEIKPNTFMSQGTYISQNPNNLNQSLGLNDEKISKEIYKEILEEEGKPEMDKLDGKNKQIARAFKNIEKMFYKIYIKVREDMNYKNKEQFKEICQQSKEKLEIFKKEILNNW